MDFSMKGGGSRVPHTYSEKWFFKNHLESFPDCENLLFKILRGDFLKPRNLNITSDLP